MSLETLFQSLKAGAKFKSSLKGGPSNASHSIPAASPTLSKRGLDFFSTHKKAAPVAANSLSVSGSKKEKDGSATKNASDYNGSSVSTSTKKASKKKRKREEQKDKYLQADAVVPLFGGGGNGSKKKQTLESESDDDGGDDDESDHRGPSSR